MKMTLRTAELARALYRAQGVADKKSTMPILAHVLLSADDSGLTVSATDLDVGLSGSYSADVHEPGAVAVHARQFYDVVKSLPSEHVEFERQDNHWVEVRSGSGRFRLVGMSADEFPALPSSGETQTFAISSSLLEAMIDRTIFCVSSDDNRHNLSGIYCESPKPNMLRLVATDGHRLALAEHEFDHPIPIQSGVIVPRKGFQELKRVLADAEDGQDAEIGFSGSSGVLRAGNVELKSRLVEGQFPDYSQVIPEQATKRVKIPRKAFSEALKRVSLLSQSRSYGVKMTFEEGELKLLAEDPEFGEAHESLPVEIEGEPLTIGFNARYLLDVMNHVSEETVFFDLSDELSPGVIRPGEGSDFLAVVMPMRI
ncbi:MAG: DNA polymerase III subunit beta [Myxococcota bacterium]